MSNIGDAATGKYHVPAISRAVAALDLLASDPRPLRLADIARELDVPRASLFSILTTLVEERLVERDGSVYRIGTRLGDLASGAGSDGGIVRASRPIVKRLVAALGESVQVAVLDDRAARYVEALEGTQTLRVATWVGKRNWLDQTSIGKALLLEIPADALRTYVPALSEEALDALQRELTESRTRGYTVDDGSGESGVYCVGAPIRGADERVVAAISVSAPRAHLSVKKTLDVTAHVLDAASEISEKLGSRGRPHLPSRPD